MKGAAAVVALFAVVFLAGCLGAPEEPALKVGMQATAETAIVQVAHERGLFAKNGLDVELVDFTAGKFALQAFLAGDLDFAVAGDVPVALAALQDHRMVVLAQISRCPEENPVLVIDDGSATPAEFFSKQKRKLTTSIGGTPEYSTYQFMKHYGIDAAQVEIIAQKPEEMVGTLSSGSVDAMSIFEPYPTLAEELLPGKTRRFEIPAKVYSPRYVLVAKREWVEQNPQKAAQIIRALLEAEASIQEDPAASQEIVSRVTGFSAPVIAKIWDKCELKNTDGAGLVEVWEGQAAWAMETGKAKEGPIPDFNQLLLLPGLWNAVGEGT